MSLNPSEYSTFSRTAKPKSVKEELSVEERFSSTIDLVQGNEPKSASKAAWKTVQADDYVYNEPKLLRPEITPGNSPYDSSDIGLELSELYYNFSETPLYHIQKNGFVSQIAPTAGTYRIKDTLVVRKIITFSSTKEMIEAHNLKAVIEHRLKGFSDNEANIIYKILADSISKGELNAKRVSIDRKYNVSSIDRDGIYIREVDAVISTDEKQMHPSDPASSQTRAELELFTDISAAGMSVELIDNSNSYNSKYVYSAGEVLEIKPKKDIRREEGLYIQSFQPGPNGVNKLTKKDHYTVEAALDKGVVHSTREGAETDGNPGSKITGINKQQEQEIMKLKQETVKIKAEAEAAKASRDMEASKAAHELDMIKHQNELFMTGLKAEMAAMEDKYKRKNIERADYYEDRSHVRKDSSEIIKTGPAMVIAAATAAGAFFAIYKNSSS